jgi:hypothetical protein
MALGYQTGRCYIICIYIIYIYIYIHIIAMYIYIYTVCILSWENDTIWLSLIYCLEFTRFSPTQLNPVLLPKYHHSRCFWTTKFPWKRNGSNSKATRKGHLETLVLTLMISRGLGLDDDTWNCLYCIRKDLHALRDVDHENVRQI